MNLNSYLMHLVKMIWMIQVFGLHPNALITHQQGESAFVIRTTLGIQPREASGAGQRPEDVVLDIAQSKGNYKGPSTY
jgi:hypothetical protein